MTPSEAAIQAECFKWYNNKYCLKHHSPRNLIFAILNEGQQHLKDQGLVAGVADLYINHYGRVMWVEMKKPKKGRQSDKQKAFQARVTENKQGEYHIAYTLEEFQNLFIDNVNE